MINLLKMWFLRLLCLAPLIFTSVQAHDVQHLEQADLVDLFDSSYDTRLANLRHLAEHPSPRTLLVLKALANDQLYRLGDRVVLEQEGKYFDAMSDQPIAVVDAASLESPILNNSLREALELMLAQSALFSDHLPQRQQAIEALLAHPQSASRALIERALLQEMNEGLRGKLQLLDSMLVVSGDTDAEWPAAFKQLTANGSTATIEFLHDLIQTHAAADALNQKRTALAKQSLADAQDRRRAGAALNTLLGGLSLGSVLLLAALGLSITYGLMGVINMAHGEFLMIGAYTTFLSQSFFSHYLPSLSAWYLLAAVPAGFLMAAAVGLLVEYVLLRHLYGRPLETLLATFGLSLLMMQSVRMLFGAQNVLVSNPFWMSGALMPWQAWFPGLQIPYNRLIIIIFSLLVMALAWVILNKTRLGLFIRATIQNRPMAACVGVPTRRVDSMAFALGTGVAGLGGVALSQIGNVGPDLGQAYIIDSFMVVVLGGVGQLAGTVLGAFGMGILSKWSEPLMGAVLSKITLLILIILFIQKKPSGLFAIKGRSVEA